MKVKLKKAKKTYYRLSGGPMDGHLVLLTDGNTLPIKMDGMSGYYANSVWRWA